MSSAKDKNILPGLEGSDAAKQDTIQAILQKVIVAHQQALSLLHQTEMAYGRLIPRQLLTLLERDSIVDVKLGDQVERRLTVMLSDIRNFTPLSESMTPGENFEFINSYLSQMEPVISKHRGIIDKYMGDAIMALFTHGADDALTGAIAMLEKLKFYNAGRERAGYVPTEIGLGLNTGIVMIGTVGGPNRMDSTVIGDVVNLTSRIEEATKTYHTPLLISQSTLYDLADPSRYHIRFLDRIRVKGKTQPLTIHEVFDGDPTELKNAKLACRIEFEQAVACYHFKEIQRAMALLEHCIKIAPTDIPARIYMARCEDYLASGQHISTGELDAGLEWREGFHVGIGEVDHAHKKLLEKINVFVGAGNKHDGSGMDELFTFVEHHALTHFKVEEDMMRSSEYPFFESHQQEHQRFVENLAALREESRVESSDRLYLSFRIQILLFDWFTGHLAKTDRHMGRFLLNLASTQTSHGV